MQGAIRYLVRAVWVPAVLVACYEDGTDAASTSTSDIGTALVSSDVVTDAPAPWGDATLIPDPVTDPEGDPGVICEITGTAGEVVDCPIVVTRATEASPPVTGLRAVLRFPDTVRPVGFFYRTCAPRPGALDPLTEHDCTDTIVEQGGMLPTGHAFTAAPPDPNTWATTGQLNLLHPTDPNRALSPAYIAGDELAGVTYLEEAVPVFVRFRVRLNIPDFLPARVRLISPAIYSPTASTPVTLTIANLNVKGAAYQGGIVAIPKDCSKATDLCDDGNVCTSDYCDPASKQCRYVAKDKSPCDDGSVCTTGDTCVEDLCVGNLITCVDADPCTLDQCHPATGCKNTEIVVKAPADPGIGNDVSYLLCFDHETFAEASTACAGKGRTLLRAEGTNEIAFVAGQIEGSVMEPPYWVGLTDAVTEGTFSWPGGPVTGDPFAPLEAPVNAADKDCVTLSGYPQTGTPYRYAVVACSAIHPFVCERACDDLNPCTADAFDAAAGKCTYTPTAAACDDGDPCTVGDACSAGSCAAGAVKDWDDDNPCTEDTCSPAGSCLNEIPAAFGTEAGLVALCPEASTWDAANDACAKLGMSVVTVQDGVLNASLLEKAQLFGYSSVWIGLTDKATEGTYVWDSGGAPAWSSWPDGTVPANAAKDCAALDTSDGSFSGTWFDSDCATPRPFFCSIECDDGNACTFDEATSEGTCVNTPAPFACDDGNMCTVGDTCLDGACAAGSPKVCNDSDPCTLDVCDQAAGCRAPRIWATADDESEYRAMCPGPLSWAAAKAYCESNGGALSEYSVDYDDLLADFGEAFPYKAEYLAAWEDGSWIAITDQATEGTYQVATRDGYSSLPYVIPWTASQPDPGPPEKDCVWYEMPGEKFSTDVCSSQRGFMCRHVRPALGPCDTATYESGKGWTLGKQADGTACDDGDACTVGEACDAGECKKGTPMDCSDGDPCTNDTCRLGICHHLPNTFQVPGTAPGVGFMVCSEPRTWEEAVATCKAKGYDPHTPESREVTNGLVELGVLTSGGAKFFVGYSDKDDESRFRKETLAGPAEVATFGAYRCGAGAFNADSDERDYPVLMTDSNAATCGKYEDASYCACVYYDPPGTTHPFLCQKTCPVGTTFVAGQCVDEPQIILRKPTAPPSWIEADPRYSTDLIALKVTAAGSGSKASREANPVPWWVLLEPGVAQQLTKSGISRVVTSRTWRRRHAHYDSSLWFKAHSQNVDWQSFEPGWGVPWDKWCGQSAVTAGDWTSLPASQYAGVQTAFREAWPESHVMCEDLPGATCVHPYSDDWKMASYYGGVEVDWFVTDGGGKWSYLTADGSTGDLAGPSATFSGLTPPFGPKATATCIESTVFTDRLSDCWQDGCMDADLKGMCMAPRADCLADRPYVTEVPGSEPIAPGYTQLPLDFPCGSCGYYDPAAGTCKPNIVQVGSKFVISCFANLGAVLSQDAMIGKLTSLPLGNDETACAAVGHSTLSLASLSSAELDAVRKTVVDRTYSLKKPGGEPMFDKNDYTEFLRARGVAEADCGVVDRDGYAYRCGSVGMPFYPSSAGVVRVLCEQSCPGVTFEAGPCASLAMSWDMSCGAGVIPRRAAEPCEDGDACTQDTVCTPAGACQGGKAKACGGDPCNLATCEPGVGCTTTPVVCNDADTCTIDTCQVVAGAAKCVTTPVICGDDGNACTENACVAKKGCLYEPTECDDKNPCTIDSCDAATGCHHDGGTDAAIALEACKPAAADPGCVTLSADQKTLTLGCLPTGSLELQEMVGKWMKSVGKDGVARYTHSSPFVNVKTDGMEGIPVLKDIGVPLPGVSMKVLATNPPSVSGSVTGIPSIDVGALDGYGASSQLTPVSPFQLAFGPAKFLGEKYFQPSPDFFCGAFQLPLLSDCEDSAPQMFPLDDDAFWFAIVLDATAVGFELETPMEDTQEITVSSTGAKAALDQAQVAGLGQIAVLFDPFDPALLAKFEDNPGISDLGLEAGAFGLSYKGQLTQTTSLPVKLWDPVTKTLTTGTTKLDGNVYLALTMKLLKLAKLPISLTGEVLVNLDPNHDGVVLQETFKALFEGKELPPVAEQGKDLDFTMLAQGSASLALRFKDLSKSLKALGDLPEFKLGDLALTFDSRLGTPTQGLRISGRSAGLELPGLLSMLKFQNNETSVRLWLVDEKTFGLELENTYTIHKLLEDHLKLKGKLTISTTDIGFDGKLEFFGQHVDANGHINPQTGAFSICTVGDVDLSFGFDGPLPKGKGNVCVSNKGVKVNLELSVNANLAKAITVPLEIAQEVFKTVTEAVEKFEKKCPKFVRWACKLVSKGVTWVSTTVSKGFEIVIQWVNQNLSIGVSVNVKLFAEWAYTDVPSISLSIKGALQFNSSSTPFGPFGAGFINKKIQVSLPDPLGTVCINPFSFPPAIALGGCQ